MAQDCNFYVIKTAQSSKGSVGSCTIIPPSNEHRQVLMTPDFGDIIVSKDVTDDTSEEAFEL